MLKLNDAGLPDILDLVPPLDRLNIEKGENKELAVLLHVLQSQADAIAANIDLLYDNWFIESCDDWVVPYIAELLNIPETLADATHIPRQRALVANTLCYRAYRGTVSALECAVQDATGWSVFLVEGLTRQFTSTQHQIQPSEQPALLNMVTEESPQPPPSPFNDYRTSYSVYQTPSSPATAGDSVTLYYWQQHLVERTNIEASPGMDGSFFLDPLGFKINLMLPVKRSSVASYSLPTPLAVPMALSRQVFEDLLMSNPALISDAFTLFFNGTALPADCLYVANLSAPLSAGENRSWKNKAADRPLALVDPEIGRVKLFTPDTHGAEKPYSIHATYWITTGGHIGGGLYDRSARLVRPDATSRSVLIAKNVSTHLQIPKGFDAVFSSLEQALKDWQSGSAEETIIQIADNDRHIVPETPLEFDENSRKLTIQSAQGFMPTLIGSLTLRSDHPGNDVWIGGCRLSGQIAFTGNIDLTLLDSTVWVEDGAAISGISNELSPSIHQHSRVSLEHCIVGSLKLPSQSCRLSAFETILGNNTDPALQGLGADSYGAPFTAIDTTFLGDIQALQVLETQNTLVIGDIKTPKNHTLSPLDGVWLSGRNTPAVELVNVEPGQPGYAALASDNAPELLNGGTEGGEFGAFHNNFNQQRLEAGHRIIQEFCPIDIDVEFIDASRTHYQR